MRALKQLKTQIISFESISTVEMSVNEKTVVHFMNRTLVIILSKCLIAHFQSKRYQKFFCDYPKKERKNSWPSKKQFKSNLATNLTTKRFTSIKFSCLEKRGINSLLFCLASKIYLQGSFQTYACPSHIKCDRKGWNWNSFHPT